MNHHQYPSTVTNKLYYRWIALGLLITEIIIAVFVPSSSFIRHSLGDLLVVILLYCLVKSWLTITAKSLAIYVLLFAFMVEFAQYFYLVDLLGIENKVLKIIMGTHFSISDLVMYTLGCLIAYGLDQWFSQYRRQSFTE